MIVDLVWLAEARDQLETIASYISVRNEAAADRLTDRLYAKAQLLVDFPRLGPRRPDLRSSFRMLVDEPYIILYRTVPDTDDGLVRRVEIVGIVDGRRDLGPLF